MSSIKVQSGLHVLEASALLDQVLQNNDMDGRAVDHADTNGLTGEPPGHEQAHQGVGGIHSTEAGSAFNASIIPPTMEATASAFPVLKAMPTMTSSACQVGEQGTSKLQHMETPTNGFTLGSNAELPSTQNPTHAPTSTPTSASPDVVPTVTAAQFWQQVNPDALKWAYYSAILEEQQALYKSVADALTHMRNRSAYEQMLLALNNGTSNEFPALSATPRPEDVELYNFLVARVYEENNNRPQPILPNGYGGYPSSLPGGPAAYPMSGMPGAAGSQFPFPSPSPSFAQEAPPPQTTNTSSRRERACASASAPPAGMAPASTSAADRDTGNANDDDDDNTGAGGDEEESGSLEAAAALARTPFASKSKLITKEKLQSLFELPIEEAARKLGIGVTVLKKKCRDFDIPRWPYRKLESIDRLIDSVMNQANAEPGAPILSPNVQSDLAHLNHFKQLIRENPSVEFDERIKKLRQANFKEEYKQRKTNPGLNPTTSSAVTPRIIRRQTDLSAQSSMPPGLDFSGQQLQQLQQLAAQQQGPLSMQQMPMQQMPLQPVPLQPMQLQQLPLAASLPSSMTVSALPNPMTSMLGPGTMSLGALPSMAGMSMSMGMSSQLAGLPPLPTMPLLPMNTLAPLPNAE